MVVVGVRRDDAPEAFSSVPGAGHVLINVRRHHGQGLERGGGSAPGPWPGKRLGPGLWGPEVHGDTTESRTGVTGQCSFQRVTSGQAGISIEDSEDVALHGSVLGAVTGWATPVGSGWG